MMMVENIPFMHRIATLVTEQQGVGEGAFATVLVTFALSSVAVGGCFFLLGWFRVGSAVYFFPRHVITGCIGGIGIFIVQTGLEVATSRPWSWRPERLADFLFSDSVYPFWLVALAFELLLRVLLLLFSAPLLPPFYFVAVPGAFYLGLWGCGVSLEQAHAAGWFFERAEQASPLLMWQLLDPRLVDWGLVLACLPTVMALTVFSLMHVPINIPSLSVSTKRDVDMNKELIAHGYANVLSGLCGGLQNYLCYSNSLLYFKCGGGGPVSGYLLALATALCVVTGPSAVEHMPRAMPGCLLLHIGVDLAVEALWDSRGSLDGIEYGSVAAITVAMTLFGMTEGLALGVLCAALTFTLQAGRHVAPVRGRMSARTLRSSRWRSASAEEVLKERTRLIQVVQLQGHLFFGNATLLTAQVDSLLTASLGEDSLRFLLLDFTLVMAIDSSAAESLAKLFASCHRRGVGVCYCRGSREGFPCSFPLSERLQSLVDEGPGGDLEMAALHSCCTRCGARSLAADRLSCLACGEPRGMGGSRSICLADTLDEGLAWCEDMLLLQHYDSHGYRDAAGDGEPLPLHLQQMHRLCGGSEEAARDLAPLLTYFTPQRLSAGQVLWRQGEASDRAALLVSGRLQFELEEEDGTTEAILPGHLVGEFGLISGQARLGTLRCAGDGADVLLLDQEAFQRMQEQQPRLAFLLAKICMGYLGHRVMHVANRIWESHCLPV
mmetsp:Transcript_14436/g.19798  ORF Transcript_14436/g.19798 Transcript_14436/m.19798 type:complete len:721 (+) Transcript_14436:603-2765(+)